jgi:hypothetical protein
MERARCQFGSLTRKQRAKGSEGVDASCLDPDGDERLWAGHVVIET